MKRKRRLIGLVHSLVSEGLRRTCARLSFLLIGVACADLEVLQLVGSLGGGNDVQEVSELLLLEVFLGQVLQVALGEGQLHIQHDLGL